MQTEQPKCHPVVENRTPSLFQGNQPLCETEQQCRGNELEIFAPPYQPLSFKSLAKRGYADRRMSGTPDEDAPEETVSLLNRVQALRSQGEHCKSYALLTNAAEGNDPFILTELAIASAYWGDVDTLNHVVSLINTLSLPHHQEREQAVRLSAFLLSQGDSVADLKRIAFLMMNIADKHRLPLGGACIDCFEEGTLTLSVTVETTDPDQLSVLNNEMISGLIAHGLQMSSCFGYFVA